MGRLWDEMDRRQRVPIGDLNKQGIPEGPGVYAMYHGGKRIYVGKAGNLQNRIWKAHCGLSKGLSNSAFRRNVAEHFGLATAAEIKKGLYRLTPEELARVRAFIESCEIAWITRRDRAGGRRLGNSHEDRVIAAADEDLGESALLDVVAPDLGRVSVIAPLAHSAGR